MIFTLVLWILARFMLYFLKFTIRHKNGTHSKVHATIKVGNKDSHFLHAALPRSFLPIKIARLYSPPDVLYML